MALYFLFFILPMVTLRGELSAAIWSTWESNMTQAGRVSQGLKGETSTLGCEGFCPCE